MGRGHWTGIFLRKGALSDICQDHGVGGTGLEFSFLKGPGHRSARQLLVRFPDPLANGSGSGNLTCNLLVTFLKSCGDPV